MDVLVEGGCLYFRTVGPWKLPLHAAEPVAECKAYRTSLPCPRNGAAVLRNWYERPEGALQLPWLEGTNAFVLDYRAIENAQMIIQIKSNHGHHACRKATYHFVRPSEE